MLEDLEAVCLDDISLESVCSWVGSESKHDEANRREIWFGNKLETQRK